MIGARPATPSDFERVAALLEVLGRPVVTPATEEACRRVFADQVASDSACPLVVEDGSGYVIGCCSLHFRPRLNRPSPDAWIPDLVVDPAARRQGAGRALLEAAERIARERGCWQLTLESGYQRTEAHAMYEGFGMVSDGVYFGKPLA